MIRRLLKTLDAARIWDRLEILGGVRSPKKHGAIYMPDGSPVPVETIMVQFGVSREKATQIYEQVNL